MGSIDPFYAEIADEYRRMARETGDMIATESRLLVRLFLRMEHASLLREVTRTERDGVRAARLQAKIQPVLDRINANAKAKP